MIHRIYVATEESLEKGWKWGAMFYNDGIETVEEFETIEEAIENFEKNGYDEDFYGVE